MATVSVVIPAYAHRDFIGLALQSVFAQTYTDYEVIVVNDGSPDDTEEVLRPWIDSGRITRYIAQKNAGQGAARNRGISVAAGKYIALLDDDDLWPAEKLEWQTAALEADPEAGVVYGALELIDGEGQPMIPPDPIPCVGPDSDAPGGDVYPALIRQNWIISPGQCLIRKSALDALTPSPFDPAIWGADDWDLWLRLAETTRFLYQPLPALRYRFHSANASRNVIRLRRNCLRVLQKQVKRSGSHRERAALAREAYAWWLRQTEDHFFHLAWLDCSVGDGRAAQEKLRFLASVRPRFALSRRFLTLWLQAARAQIAVVTAHGTREEG